ncbi:MAG TPA: dienelactone hydrolase family protein, partial [Aggregatilineales bacterium]|nr:dienelactone hydrolase family protein [Aggregatilineales bacterium]
TADKINGWAAKFKAAGKINEMVIYKGAAHAFFNDTRSSYDKDAAADAWQRIQDWFKKYLTGMPATMEPTPAATSSN